MGAVLKQHLALLNFTLFTAMTDTDISLQSTRVYIIQVVHICIDLDMVEMPITGLVILYQILGYYE